MTLFERGDTLSGLSDPFAECREGQERIAILTGAAGMGKTEITRIFASQAVADQGPGNVVCAVWSSVGVRRGSRAWWRVAAGDVGMTVQAQQADGQGGLAGPKPCPPPEDIPDALPLLRHRRSKPHFTT